MERLVMEKCCCKCGWGLRTCALTLCIIELFHAAIGLILAITAHILYAQDPEKYDKKAEEFKNISHFYMYYEHQRLINENFHTAIAAYHILLIAVTIVLLVGLIKKSRTLILPWLLVQGSFIIGVTYYCLIFVIIVPIPFISTWIVYVPFLTYEYVVMHSYYYQISVPEKGGN